MILDERRKASLARHLLLRLEPRAHLRECISWWAAESVAKLHPRVSVPGTHTITIEEPPADAPPGHSSR